MGHFVEELHGPAATMNHRLLRWFFQNRETGEITIAQMPNLPLWIVVIGSALIWALHPPGRMGVNLECLVTGSLFVWALDEVLRGVNPWRRCLGAAVLVYMVVTMV